MQKSSGREKISSQKKAQKKPLWLSVCKYVLTHEALAKLRLGVRSDVIRTRDVNAVTYDGLRNNYTFRQTRIVLGLPALSDFFLLSKEVHYAAERGY